MVQLIWARHGMTRENAENRYIGHADPPLSFTGWRQAVRLGAAWQDTGFAVVYTSDLRRARDTARAIARRQPQMPVVETPLLRELHFGEWERLTYDEIVRQDRDALFRFYEDPWQAAPPNGETLTDLRQRLDVFLTEVIRRHNRDETILAVSHGGVIRLFWAWYLARDPARLFTYAIRHGETLACRYDITRGRWTPCN